MRQMSATTGTAQKPMAATRPCHMPRLSQGAISAM